jgi:hypothetical protein
MCKFNDFPFNRQVDIVNKFTEHITLYLQAFPAPLDSISYVIVQNIANILAPFLFVYTFGYLYFINPDLVDIDDDVVPPNTPNHQPEPSPFPLDEMPCDIQCYASIASLCH